MDRLATGKKESGIRFLKPESDLGQLADLIESAFGEELTDGGERVLRELRFLGWLGPLNVLFTGSDIDGILTGFVWEQDGRIVGNVTVNHPMGHPQRWQISNVAVLDGFRQRGIGRQLVEAALDLILRRGGQTAYLFVRDDNPVAIHLYHGVGFADVDRTTDLKYVRPAARNRRVSPQQLRPLTLGEAEALFQLAMAAASPGQLWLSPTRKQQFVFSAEERIFRQVESVFTQELESQWGLFHDQRLAAGLVLRATRLWNRGRHQLKLWVRPDERGKVEDMLAADVVAMLGAQARRPLQLALPACEGIAIDALLHHGFAKVRTLILMKLDL